MATILDGKKLAEKILAKVKQKIKKKSFKLQLAVIQVGENPIFERFVGQKKKFCLAVGIKFKLFKYPASIENVELKKEIKKIVASPENSGLVIQLHLPKKFWPEVFLNLIPEEKDPDVLSEESLGKFYQGTLGILPPTVAGILALLKEYKINLKGKNVVIVGAGRLVGFPLALQLLKERATLSVLNQWTKNAPSFTKKADILISGVGRSGLIKGNMVRQGAVVIDAGTSLVKGRLVGDVDFQSVSKKAGYITPVPGGVGPLTVACLLDNLAKLDNF